MASAKLLLLMVNYYTPVTPHLQASLFLFSIPITENLRLDNLPNQAVSINVIYKNSCISKNT